MALPKNERRTLDCIEKKTMWIYGKPYSGKTYFANAFPDVLMLNTDGNVKFVDAPYVAIKDMMEGRVPKPAWEVFKATIDELNMNNHDFKTIVVDLLEGTYQHCRHYVLNREGYTHESDGGFGKGWALVDDEFLTTIQKLLHLNVENIILISHEVMGDITKKTGDKVSKLEPNIRDKVALQISGMVDFSGRMFAEGEDRRIEIKPSEVVFGGSRVGFAGQTIPATYEAVCGLYDVKTLAERKPPVAEMETPETPRRKVLTRKDDGE